jgi:hypothetical protein
MHKPTTIPVKALKFKAAHEGEFKSINSALQSLYFSNHPFLCS